MIAGARPGDHEGAPASRHPLVLHARVWLSVAGVSWEVTRGNLLIIPDKRAGYAEKVLVVRSGIENRADTETTVSRPSRLATPIGCCPLHSQRRSETDAW
jgi:hypothetical protein